MTRVSSSTRWRNLHYIVRHEAVQKMRVGPSESACRSPMNREVHVGFCEGVGVRLPRATRRAPGMARSTITGAVNQ